MQPRCPQENRVLRRGRDGIDSVLNTLTANDDAIKCCVIDLCGLAFAAQIGRRAIRMLGMGLCRLQ